MSRSLRWSVRVALVALLFGSVLAQVLVPVLASATGDLYPEVEHLVVPYSIVGVLVIACVQAALLATWRLVSLVRDHAIFARGAMRWVDLITACGALAVALSAGVMLHLLAIVGLGGPGVVIALVACLSFGMGFLLVMRVLRGLLATAIADREELDEVI